MRSPQGNLLQCAIDHRIIRLPSLSEQATPSILDPYLSPGPIPFRPLAGGEPQWLDISTCMAQLLLPSLEAVPPLDEMSVRADYEALLDRCARLMAYAQSSPRHVFWPVIDRQNRLAEDDLTRISHSG